MRVDSIAISGVGGFIGMAVAERALAAGARVRGIEIDEAAAARAAALGVEVEVASVADSEAAKWLVDGAEIALHTAAIVREAGDWRVFRQINVEGTRTVLGAAAKAGCRHAIHLSSVMVYGFEYPPFVSEDGPLDGADNPYCQTKIESEAAALSVYDEGAGGTPMRLAIVRPGDVYGPESQPWVQRPLELMRRGLFVLPNGGRGICNHVWIDNLVDGLEAVVERGFTGRAVNIADGRNTTWREYFSRLAHAAGLPAPRSAPRALLRGLFTALSPLPASLFAGQSPHPNALDFLRRPHRVSNQRARDELGWTPQIGLDEGMKRIRDAIRSEAHKPDRP